jgi:hypothetical protein
LFHGLGWLLGTAVFVCVLWTFIVMREDRVSWRKLPAVCFGPSMVGVMIFLFSLWWRLARTPLRTGGSKGGFVFLGQNVSRRLA